MGVFGEIHKGYFVLKYGIKYNKINSSELHYIFQNKNVTVRSNHKTLKITIFKIHTTALNF